MSRSTKSCFVILDKLDVGYFFYIGGNDSMDTIGKLADYGTRIDSDIRFMGVPKTIDNDLMVTDHTPGYGSAAKYIGVVMKEIYPGCYGLRHQICHRCGDHGPQCRLADRRRCPG